MIYPMQLFDPDNPSQMILVPDYNKAQSPTKQKV